MITHKLYLNIWGETLCANKEMYQLKVRKEYSLTKELHLTIHLKLNFIQIFFPSIHICFILIAISSIFFQKLYISSFWSSIKTRKFSEFYPHQKRLFFLWWIYRFEQTSWIMEIWSLSQIFLGIVECVSVCENIPLYVLISETFKTTKIINNSWA